LLFHALKEAVEIWCLQKKKLYSNGFSELKMI
jgi:hypothetical protein